MDNEKLQQHLDTLEVVGSEMDDTEQSFTTKNKKKNRLSINLSKAKEDGSEMDDTEQSFTTKNKKKNRLSINLSKKEDKSERSMGEENSELSPKKKKKNRLSVVFSVRGGENKSDRSFNADAESIRSEGPSPSEAGADESEISITSPLKHPKKNRFSLMLKHKEKGSKANLSNEEELTLSNTAGLDGDNANETEDLSSIDSPKANVIINTKRKSLFEKKSDKLKKPKTPKLVVSQAGDPAPPDPVAQKKENRKSRKVTIPESPVTSDMLISSNNNFTERKEQNTPSEVEKKEIPPIIESPQTSTVEETKSTSDQPLENPEKEDKTRAEKRASVNLGGARPAALIRPRFTSNPNIKKPAHEPSNITPNLSEPSPRDDISPVNAPLSSQSKDSDFETPSPDTLSPKSAGRQKIQRATVMYHETVKVQKDKADDISPTKEQNLISYQTVPISDQPIFEEPPEKEIPAQTLQEEEVKERGKQLPANKSEGSSSSKPGYSILKPNAMLDYQARISKDSLPKQSPASSASPPKEKPKEISTEPLTIAAPLLSANQSKKEEKGVSPPSTDIHSISKEEKAVTAVGSNNAQENLPNKPQTLHNEKIKSQENLTPTKITQEIQNSEAQKHTNEHSSQTSQETVKGKGKQQDSGKSTDNKGNKSERTSKRRSIKITQPNTISPEKPPVMPTPTQPKVQSSEKSPVIPDQPNTLSSEKPPVILTQPNTLSPEKFPVITAQSNTLSPEKPPVFPPPDIKPSLDSTTVKHTQTYPLPHPKKPSRPNMVKSDEQKTPKKEESSPFKSSETKKQQIVDTPIKSLDPKTINIPSQESNKKNTDTNTPVAQKPIENPSTTKPQASNTKEQNPSVSKSQDLNPSEPKSSRSSKVISDNKPRPQSTQIQKLISDAESKPIEKPQNVPAKTVKFNIPEKKDSSSESDTSIDFGDINVTQDSKKDNIPSNVKPPLQEPKKVDNTPSNTDITSKQASQDPKKVDNTSSNTNTTTSKQASQDPKKVDNTSSNTNTTTSKQASQDPKKIDNTSSNTNTTTSKQASQDPKKVDNTSSTNTTTSKQASQDPKKADNASSNTDTTSKPASQDPPKKTDNVPPDTNTKQDPPKKTDNVPSNTDTTTSKQASQDPPKKSDNVPSNTVTTTYLPPKKSDNTTTSKQVDPPKPLTETLHEKSATPSTSQDLPKKDNALSTSKSNLKTESPTKKSENLPSNTTTSKPTNLTNSKPTSPDSPKKDNALSTSKSNLKTESPAPKKSDNVPNTPSKPTSQDFPKKENASSSSKPNLKTESPAKKSDNVPEKNEVKITVSDPKKLVEKKKEQSSASSSEIDSSEEKPQSKIISKQQMPIPEPQLTNLFSQDDAILEDIPHDVLYKIIIIGDSGVGKTQFCNRWLHNTIEETRATLNIGFGIKCFRVGDSIVKVQLWDTAGQERYRSIARQYYRGSHGVILMYTINEESTFKRIPTWIEDLNNYISEDCRLLLIGNKSDLEDERQISTEEALLLSKEKGMAFLETSAINGSNCSKAIQLLLQEIHSLEQRKTTVTVKKDSSSTDKKNEISQSANIVIKAPRNPDPAITLTNSSRGQTAAKKKGCCA